MSGRFASQRGWDLISGPNGPGQTQRLYDLKHHGAGGLAPLPGRYRAEKSLVSKDLAGKDLALLAVLGIVGEGFGDLDQIVTAARSLARVDWQPTPDSLMAAVEWAQGQGLLAIQSGGNPSAGLRLVLTPQGQDHLRDLIQRPLPLDQGSVSRAAVTLKICFLGILDAHDGAQVLDSLSRAYRRDLAWLQKAREACPAVQGSASRAMERDIERIKQDLAWLQQLRADFRFQESN